jgi:hypothetical protein
MNESIFLILRWKILRNTGSAGTILLWLGTLSTRADMRLFTSSGLAATRRSGWRETDTCNAMSR